MTPGQHERLLELKRALNACPRVDLATLPTPLQHCPRLTKALAGPGIWMKRDDLTGLAGGGNKTRMFEFVFGQALQDGVDTVVAGAAVQSNYCRQIAAASAVLGLDCHLLLRGIRGSKDDEVQGGLLMDLLLGAEVERIETDDWMVQAQHIQERARQLEAAGKKVYVGRMGNERQLGRYVCGYVQALVEIIEQAETFDLDIDEIWVCSSDATQAGLALALAHLQSPIRLVGIPAVPAPIVPGWTFSQCMAHFANQCAQILDLPTRLTPAQVISNTDYVGPGYGIVTPAGREAMKLVATCEGIVLDPVYTSKAMAGLIDHVRTGKIPADKNIVFIHTGGLPALFAYAGEVLEPGPG